MSHLFRRTPLAPAPVEPKPLFTQEQVDAMVAILTTVGLQDVEDFSYHATHEASYHGSDMEYTERGNGMRFIVMHPTRGAGVQVIRHGAPTTWFSDELIEEANRKLVALLAPTR